MGIFRPKELVRPKSVSEAVEVLNKGEGRARLVAGNTTLYDLAQHSGLDDVETLVDIAGLGLNHIQSPENDNELEVGAATTFSEIARCSSNSHWRGLEALFETARKITPPQVRNMGTIGGAICTGIPFLDMPTTVLALKAKIMATSPRGNREIIAENFFVDYFQTSIEYDEVVTSIVFQFSSLKAGSAFIKLGRISTDFAVVNVTSYLSLQDDDKCEEARIALGAVSNTPIRWSSLEQQLVGKKINHDVIVRMMNDVKVELDPMPTLGASSKYKKLVIPKLVKDSLNAALDRALNSTRAD